MNLIHTPDAQNCLVQSAAFTRGAILAAAVALGLSAVAGAQTVAQTAAQAATVVAPSDTIWDSGDGFTFDVKAKKLQKTRQSASGIACHVNSNQQRICLVVFDEGTQAGFATLSDSTLRPDAKPLQFAGDQQELDAEAAAGDGRYLYITGSHAVKRTDCANNPGSRHVLRLPLDPVSGRAAPSQAADTGRLWDIMQTLPELQAFLGERKCLGTQPPPKAPLLKGQQGINIEGLALQGGRLVFGFRGPVIDGTALTLAVDAQALFEGGDVKPQVTRLALGAHRGIRDMVAVSDGILLLAGPDDDGDSASVGWAVFHWDGMPGTRVVSPKLLARLDLSAVKQRFCDAEIKPEGLTVLAETPQDYQVLVLSDGLCDGGPLLFKVSK
ncbi:MAG: hypothetical protein BWK72_04530 [Rhodoferax ferrireducens]|uniref:DUF3616 domain-containing protein n=1 Tax=Rhodoferax ferrireducens TaxID=192843 RepID=A0A1W9KX43_9BURK|nr:MAG: hypothetical protein BWK72_04530 [Rhodoferax ferrireducens]